MIIFMQMIGQETTKLRDYLPTNPYDWQWRTCSDDHIAPAQKPNRSVTYIRLSTRLAVYPVNMPVPGLYGHGRDIPNTAHNKLDGHPKGPRMLPVRAAH